MLAALLGFAGLVVPATPAFAREVTEAERTSLQETVFRFDRAMRQREIPYIIDIVPPKVVAQIAADAGADPRRLREVMIKQTREVMGSGVLRGFRMDMARATYRTTPGGSPYALIPTFTTVRAGGRDEEKSSVTLAMMDGGRWYLLDLNQPSRVAIFTRVYPDFRGAPLGGQGI